MPQLSRVMVTLRACCCHRADSELPAGGKGNAAGAARSKSRTTVFTRVPRLMRQALRFQMFWNLVSQTRQPSILRVRVLKGDRYRRSRGDGDLTESWQGLYHQAAEVALIRSACSGNGCCRGEPECFGCAQNSARVPSNPRDSFASKQTGTLVVLLVAEAASEL
jgi:hypothetical protein